MRHRWLLVSAISMTWIAGCGVDLGGTEDPSHHGPSPSQDEGGAGTPASSSAPVGGHDGADPGGTSTDDPDGAAPGAPRGPGEGGAPAKPNLPTVICGLAESDCNSTCCNAKRVPVCSSTVPCLTGKKIECDEASDCGAGGVCCGRDDGDNFTTTCQTSCDDDKAVVCKTGGASCANGKSCDIRFALVIGVCDGS